MSAKTATKRGTIRSGKVASVKLDVRSKHVVATAARNTAKEEEVPKQSRIIGGAAAEALTAIQSDKETTDISVLERAKYTSGSIPLVYDDAPEDGMILIHLWKNNYCRNFIGKTEGRGDPPFITFQMSKHGTRARFESPFTNDPVFARHVAKSDQDLDRTLKHAFELPIDENAAIPLRKACDVNCISRILCRFGVWCHRANVKKKRSVTFAAAVLAALYTEPMEGLFHVFAEIVLPAETRGHHDGLENCKDFCDVSTLPSPLIEQLSTSIAEHSRFSWLGRMALRAAYLGSGALNQHDRLSEFLRDMLGHNVRAQFNVKKDAMQNFFRIIQYQGDSDIVPYLTHSKTPDGISLKAFERGAYIHVLQEQNIENFCVLPNANVAGSLDKKMWDETMENRRGNPFSWDRFDADADMRVIQILSDLDVARILHPRFPDGDEEDASYSGMSEIDIMKGRLAGDVVEDCAVLTALSCWRSDQMEEALVQQTTQMRDVGATAFWTMVCVAVDFDVHCAAMVTENPLLKVFDARNYFLSVLWKFHKGKGMCDNAYRRDLQATCRTCMGFAFRYDSFTHGTVESINLSEESNNVPFFFLKHRGCKYFLMDDMGFEWYDADMYAESGADAGVAVMPKAFPKCSLYPDLHAALHKKMPYTVSYRELHLCHVTLFLTELYTFGRHRDLTACEESIRAGLAQRSSVSRVNGLRESDDVCGNILWPFIFCDFRQSYYKDAPACTTVPCKLVHCRLATREEDRVLTGRENGNAASAEYLWKMFHESLVRGAESFASHNSLSHRQETTNFVAWRQPHNHDKPHSYSILAQTTDETKDLCQARMHVLTALKEIHQNPRPLYTRVESLLERVIQMQELVRLSRSILPPDATHGNTIAECMAVCAHALAEAMACDSYLVFGK